ncbi:MAG: phosphoribosylglycinamide formyltransferase [Cyclobacteriaceae bacterium]|nr:phosphoribosylglycinamide formyltransferase [Cyclobacteriaceae bacterium]
MKKRIAIFASGSGTNAEEILKKFHHHPAIEVVVLLSNNPSAFALKRAEKFEVETSVFDKQTFKNTDQIVSLLQDKKVDLLVLAGFMWLIPKNLVNAFPNKIINIHPALLPKYGGKGMYGMHVHNAIKENKETETGITIHYVNEHYDEGQIIFQAKCNLSPSDAPEDIANKVHQLEHAHYPEIIEGLFL